MVGARVEDSEEVHAVARAERGLEQVATRAAAVLAESEGRAGGFARCGRVGRGRRRDGESVEEAPTHGAEETGRPPLEDCVLQMFYA